MPAHKNGALRRSTVLVVNKVVAFITQAERLLVFDHVDFPEAGTQVPAGTLREQEPPDVGVMREAWEETGLDGLRLLRFLGEYDLRLSESLVHHRFVYHLEPTSPTPERWLHDELHDGLAKPTKFSFRWVPMSNIPQLFGEKGRLLDRLH